MKKLFKQYIDRISLVVSCIAMMLMFLSPSPLISKVLLFAAGLVGIGYLGYAAFLWSLSYVFISVFSYTKIIMAHNNGK